MKLLKLTALVGLILMSTPAYPQERIATLVSSRGFVQANSQVIEPGDFVYKESMVTTGEGSFAILHFIDGAKVTIKPNSEVFVDEYLLGSKDTDRATLTLLKGGLHVLTGALSKQANNNYKIQTEVALLGVRGTEFDVEVIKE